MGWFRSTPDEPDAPTMEERLAAITPGVPGRCPECDGLGYIDTIDLAHRYQIQHCKECLHRWEYLFDANGAVVGLTELDDTGQPVARTRVRPLRAASTGPATEPVAPVDPPAVPVETAPADDIPVTAVAPDPDAVASGDPATADDVLDLRDPPAAADAPEASVEHMSAAEWLRHSIRH